MEDKGPSLVSIAALLILGLSMLYHQKMLIFRLTVDFIGGLISR